jgi:hypothetical protein
MTMIGDMRFRKGKIEGTCAQYFLLVDTLVLQHLCVSAHLNCDKLRDYIRRFDSEESDESRSVADTRQTPLPFLQELVQLVQPASVQDRQSDTLLPRELGTVHTKHPANNGAGATIGVSALHQARIRRPSVEAVSQRNSAAQMMRGKGSKRPSRRQDKRA